MHVGYYLPGLDSDSLSAPEKCSVEVLRGVRRNEGVETTLIGHGNTSLSGVPSVTIPKPPILGEKYLNVYDFDVIHFNRTADFRIPKFLSAETVLSFHGDLHWEYPGFFDSPVKPSLYKLLDRIKIPQYDGVHFVSNDVSARMCERVSARRSGVIHNGVDLDKYKPERDESIIDEYGLPERYLLHVSNYDRKKNAERLLSAYAHAAGETMPPLLICGGGWAESNTVSETIIENDLENKVRMLGYVPESHLSTLYSAAALTIYPSLHETFGLPILESLACGTPVVTSNTYSMPEVLGGHGFLCDPTDYTDIAQKIREGVNADINSEKLRSYARTFSWDRAASEMFEFYKFL